MGHAMGGVMCVKGHHMGGVITWVGLVWGHPSDNGATLVARAIRNAIRANRFARIIRN